ncbi:MAG: tetratricopeptide repeat protein [Proteobacteria bacterium]|nr:tetratricopeptide repeat protein [Pseudomonadota bacterium]
MSATDPAGHASLAAAVRDHRAGRLREAVSAYEALLLRTPNDADLLQLLGVALAQLGRHAEGAVRLARSLELQPGRPGVLLNLAQALHTLGREQEALRACESALALDPSLAGGYRTRAAVLTALGRRDEALANAGQAVRLARQDAGAHADLGAALEAVGREGEALECFERATTLDPNLVAAHHNQAVLLARQGQHERALQSLDRALALQPHKAALHGNRGNALKALGRLPEAAESYSLALALEPGNPATLHNRAVVHALLGKHTEALRDYDALAAQGQESGADLIGRGAALVALRRYDEALAPLERATKLLPGEAEAHIQCGMALLNVERNAEAVESFDRALALRPDVPEVLNNRGIALTVTGRLSEALSSFIRSSVLDGNTADTHTNLGIVLKSLGRPLEAATSFDRALALKPNDASARFALAFLYLSLGEFARGWPLYEARFDVPALGNPARRFNAPRWRGSEPLSGKTLLVHAEQGLGDVIQFCRYLPLLTAQGAVVVFEVMPSLEALLATLPGAIRIIGRGEPAPPIDYYCPLLSLPHALKTRFDTIPAPVPYLAAQPERIARWAQRLRALPGMRVGIAWQGNLQVEKLVWARGRSIPLAALEPLARLRGVSLVSLQKGPGLEQLRQVPFADRIVDLSSELDSGADAFLDTAAVMAGLDLVVSSDTAIAHLAGALGRPVWTALNASPEWRWLLKCDDSPWYPTMRLFRQTTAGDWSGVVDEISAALQALAPAWPVGNRATENV